MKSTAAQRKKKRAAEKAWRLANPERYKAIQRRKSLKRKYGLTQKQYDELLSQQDFKCAICRTDDPGADRDWRVDHCHSSGRVRGLLCNHCNVMLGMSRDSENNLLRAVDYLKAA